MKTFSEKFLSLKFLSFSRVLCSAPFLLSFIHLQAYSLFQQLANHSLTRAQAVNGETAPLIKFSYPTLSQTWPEIYFRPPCAFKTSVFMCPAVHTSARS